MRFLSHLFGPSPAPFRARLTLESLDGRLSPSSIPGTVALDPAALVLPVATTSSTNALPVATANANTLVPADAAPAPPKIINFTWAEPSGGGIVTFSGQVVDPAPAGLTVKLGGDPKSLQGVTTVTDANGKFSKTLIMNTNGTDNGTATARTTNQQGVQSDYAMTYIIV